MRAHERLSAAAMFLLFANTADAFASRRISSSSAASSSAATARSIRVKSIALYALPSNRTLYSSRSISFETRSKNVALSAFSVDTSTTPLANILVEEEDEGSSSIIEWGSCQSILTTALLVTGNTVGAGTLALPALSAKPGLCLSTGMFAVAYVVNLLSGLILAEVAIKQNEANGQDAPSSFREFAASTMDWPIATNGIAAVCLFVNICAVTYSLGQAGVILSELVGIDHVAMSALCASLLAVLGATQSRVQISQITSLFVTGLFISLAGLLLPGLPHVQDPLGTFLSPGTSPNVIAGMREAAPIMLTTLIFQNIVPPVAKILDYDRVKVVVALVLGSFLPLLIYLAWSFVVLGGGVNPVVGVGSPFMTAFSVTAVTGSAIGCTMAASEELQAILDGIDNDIVGTEGKLEAVSRTDNKAIVFEQQQQPAYSWPAVATAVSIPFVCSTLCPNGDYAQALRLSGGFGIPILYGAIPVAMAWTQRQKLQDQANLVPGGNVSLGLVSTAFGLFMMNSVVSAVQGSIAS
jgi:tyrosine-specific transport protein